MAEIRISGKKMIKTVQKEFTEKFPYLKLVIYPFSGGKKKIKPYSGDEKICDVRKKDSVGEISVHGRTLAKNLEDNFEKIYGLHVHVCFTEKNGKTYNTTGSDMTLTQLNDVGKEEGWKKGVSN